MAVGVAVAAVVLTFAMTASAGADPIRVNTTEDTIQFNTGPGGAPAPVPGRPGGVMPVYASAPVLTSVNPREYMFDPVEGKCSLREAIQAVNLQMTVGACDYSGTDTIILDPGTYEVWDNLFISRKMTIEGPNAGIPGNSPDRKPEATLEFRYNPNWAGQISMFWLNGTGSVGSDGAGTVFDGVEMTQSPDYQHPCATANPCETAAVLLPTKQSVEGYTLTDSIFSRFNMAAFLGGTDTITHNLFEDMPQITGQSASGHMLYSDQTYVSDGTKIEHNVFLNPSVTAANIQGDMNRGIVTNTTFADNAVVRTGGGTGNGVQLFNTQGAVVKDNLFLNSRPGPTGTRTAFGVRMNRVNDVQITGNTLWGWGGGIEFANIGLPGTDLASSNVDIWSNRIYNNRIGIRVVVPTPGDLLTNVTANDNWWGANGGPGSTGDRPDNPSLGNGTLNPVNGITYVSTNFSAVNPQPEPGTVAHDTWLHLTCTVPDTLHVDEPAPVVGQVVGMPTVESSPTTPPWFASSNGNLDWFINPDRNLDPLMAASSDLGTVTGFDRVPNDGPENAQLNGVLTPDHEGAGKFFVDLDSERATCPFDATKGPDPEIDKRAESHTVAAGGLERYRIRVANDGPVAARNWWVCDRLPRKLRFVSATRKLRRLDHMPCLVVPRLAPHDHVSFQLTARVARDAPKEETNVEEVIPGIPPDETVPGKPPEGGGPTDPPAGGPPIVTSPAPPTTKPPEEEKPVVIPPDAESKATVKVTHRPTAPPPPRVTG